MVEKEKILKAVANKNRLRILKMLEVKSMCVCEITCVIGIKQPSVTRHLLKLKEAGLIKERRKGLYTEFYFSIDNPMSTVWKALSEILDGEELVQRDILKSENADRHKICRKQLCNTGRRLKGASKCKKYS